MEEELPYGSVSSPVKIGNTVHRRTGAWTPTIHELLGFLKAKGFSYSPAILGSDEKGREVLEFLPGIAATRPWPASLLKDGGLVQAAEMLKRYHTIVRDFRPTNNVEWRIGKIEIAPDQIVRHGDLGPWNMLWRGDVLTGLIDWDFAEPGRAITDLAQMAYYLVPLRGEKGWREAGFAERPDLLHRLAVLCEVYGQFSTKEVLTELQTWLHEELRRVRELGEESVEPWRDFLWRGDDVEILKDLTWLEEFQGE